MHSAGGGSGGGLEHLNNNNAAAPYESTEGYATSHKDFSFAATRNRPMLGLQYSMNRTSKLTELEQKEMSGYEANTVDDLDSDH